MSNFPESQKTSRSALSGLRAGVAASALLLATAAWSATPANKAEIEARFQQDRAACMASDAGQERSSCLREAGAVRAEALRGVAKGGESEAMRMRNAMQRCQEMPAERKAICERMVRGEGSASGSVEGGGVIRELIIMEPAPSMPPGARPLPPAGSPPPAR